ncbi:preprotein translocase subunit SecA [Candidatus Bipolaricaulota bacterium]|nr:preprotein translocase subunit SecA [Candidatus Bipolaricaulota bacterium]
MGNQRFRHAVNYLLGQTDAQQLARYDKEIQQINERADEVSALSDAALREEIDRSRKRLADGASRKEIRPLVFSVIREVATRVLEMRPFDVQILGALVMDDRRIAEMQTGEGKTLVATMPAALNALVGKVHVVTVNDYLARRDREWMGPAYEAVGLSVGLLQDGMEVEERKAAYACDIIYGTNNQFGFDYLRDNMVLYANRKVQGPLDFAIVDEIDNILIDEARTPLIISGATSQTIDKYRKFAGIARSFRRDIDFDIDEEARRLSLTDEGVHKAERLLSVENLYDETEEARENQNYLLNALRALHLFKKESHYIVKDSRVMIVDEFTGRLMPDRRFSDGLHQALEAKEGLTVQRESQTLAQITLQHYFGLYGSLCGMTGTAKTEEEEFKQIYGLPVLEIPTNRPLIREALPDRIFRTEKAKFEAIADETKSLHEQGRPVLIGTNSIEKSEQLSRLLKARKLAHTVLNAKHHEKEAEIVQDAGQPGAITVATNMAGRGTDIKLGENVSKIGGLHVIGCQRHESRRIDNQLLGRAGRQGDPGSSQFYLSLTDDLLRIFGGERIGGLLDRLGMEEGEAIEHEMLTGAIRRAQKRVEGRNFEIRKRLIDYDMVMSKQRDAIYSLRDRLLLPPQDSAEKISLDDLDDRFDELFIEYVANLVSRYADPSIPEEDWNLEGLGREVAALTGQASIELAQISAEQLSSFLLDQLRTALGRQKERLGPQFPLIARYLMLGTIDEQWLAHLYTLDDLREGIGWTAYGGTDPLVVFKRESFTLFQEMLARASAKIVRLVLSARLAPAKSGAPHDAQRKVQLVHNSASALGDARQSASHPPRGKSKPVTLPTKVGRNDPCPCGSGKKYKNCCGKDS